MIQRRYLCLSAALICLAGRSYGSDVNATWLNGNGNWSDPTQWSTNPSYPNNGSTKYSVTVSAGGVTLDRAITVDQLALNYTPPSSNPPSGTTVNLDYPVTVNSTFSCNTATVVGSPALNLQGTATFSNTNYLYELTLNLSGTTSVSGMTVLNQGATLNNQPGATLNLADGSNLGGAACTINNNGTLNVNAATTGAVLGGTINNSGTINVNSGALSLITGGPSGGGTFSGNLHVASGATLNLNSTLNFTETSTITGAGNINWSTGPNVINSAYNVSGSTDLSGVNAIFGQMTNPPQVSMGSVTFDSGAYVFFEGPLQVSGASVISGPSTLVDFGASAVLSSLTLGSGTISGTSGAVTVNNTLELDSGTITQLVTIDAKGNVFLNSSHTSPPELDGTLNCFGTLTMPNTGFTGSLLLGANAALNFMPGANLEIPGLNIVGSHNEGQLWGTLTNQGTLILDSSLIASGINVENKGTIKAIGDGIIASNGTANTPAFMQDGGKIILSNGGLTGTFALNSGSLSGNGALTFATVMNNGVIAPSGGVLSLDQDSALTLGANSILAFSLGGTQPGVSYGQMANSSSTSGNITLGGRLQVSFANGFQAQVSASDVFTLISGGSTFGGQLTNAQDGQRMYSADGVGSFLVSTSGGTLTLSNFQRSAFGTWQLSKFSSSQLSDPTVSGISGTPQHDGVPNLLKYIYGIDPTVPMSSLEREKLPATGVDQGTGDLTLTYRKNLQDSEMIVQAESSTDLQTWHPETSTQIGGDQSEAIMEAKVPLTAGSPEFLRLSVIIP